MKLFLFYLKERKIQIFVFILFCLIFLCAFLLYDLPAGAVVYPAIVCTCIGVFIMAVDYYKAKRKHKLLSDIADMRAELIDKLPQSVTQDDEDYQKIIENLKKEIKINESAFNEKYADMVDYYTVWAHQIKTPIASMRLTLEGEDSTLSRTISDDLFRIEQYVEMVLCYLRLDSDSSDYVIATYSLDKILKQAFRRFSGSFISKKLKLTYEETGLTVLTDEKWLLFVIEQILSNAVKYTSEGGEISVYCEDEGIICIKDNGIGIAPEDMPRIFERGYTGLNGRTDKKASGLGLYLCRRICENLNHRIWAESCSGTAVYIDLRRRKLETE